MTRRTINHQESKTEIRQSEISNRKSKILVIEDNEQSLYLITFILEKSSYEVIQARDGLEGVEKAVQERPNLILLDIQLPVMDGYEIAGRMKSMPELKDIPIVALTSYAMVGDRERILAAGCDGYIEKPINPETFMDELERYLKASRFKSQAPSS